MVVRRNTDGSFESPIRWLDLNDPSVAPATALTSANSVAGDAVVGVVFAGSLPAYQAQVNQSFQLPNVITIQSSAGGWPERRAYPSFDRS